MATPSIFPDQKLVAVVHAFEKDEIPYESCAGRKVRVQGKEFDLAYTVGWLVEMLGDDAGQVRRINEIAREVAEWEATLDDGAGVS